MGHFLQKHGFIVSSPAGRRSVDFFFFCDSKTPAGGAGERAPARRHLTQCRAPLCRRSGGSARRQRELRWNLPSVGAELCGCRRASQCRSARPLPHSGDAAPRRRGKDPSLAVGVCADSLQRRTTRPTCRRIPPTDLALEGSHAGASSSLTESHIVRVLLT